MGWQQYHHMIYEDLVPPRTIKVRKQVWDPADQEFREQWFVRVYISNRQDLVDAIDYHRRNHGEPCYQDSWWHDDQSVWLRESLATWWLLKHG